jgi:alpha-beta hydrolase superfamily lysophospholipase
LPGFYHELFNEPEKQDVFERVTEWLDKRARANAE